MVAQIQAHDAASALNNTAMLASQSGLMGARENSVSNVLGMGITSNPQLMSVLVNDAIFLIIGIGLIAILWKYKFYKEKIEIGFRIGCVFSVGLLAAFVLIPQISYEYGATRLFLQCLVLLAPLFVIGSNEITRIIKRPNWNVVLMLIVLISLLICSTHLQYHFSGIPTSVYYETNGTPKGEYYIYDPEIQSAKWLNVYGEKNLMVYGDAVAVTRLRLGYRNVNYTNYFASNTTILNNSYVFSGRTNIKENIVYKKIGDKYVLGDLRDFENIFKVRNLIYDNGWANIFLYKF